MFSRSDTSLLAQWWWTIDRWLLLQIFVLICVGVVLVVTASPHVAQKIGADSFFFAKRHVFYTMLGLTLLSVVSMLDPERIRLLAALMFVCMFFATILTLFGTSIKGAKRWIDIFGFSLQPSEFLKPSFVVLTAWLFAEEKDDPYFPGQKIALIGLGATMLVLLCQPDVGTTILVAATFTGQFILAGMPLIWVLYALFLGGSSLVGAYFLFPHVAQRIDRYIFSGNVDKYAEGYQIHQSLESFMSGGWFGLGPGEGIIKRNLPDAHADFIFSVAGEEFGLIFCIVIVLLFTAILWQVSARALQETSYFHIFATMGLVIQFAIQTLINVASSIHLIPTKGMTLPFISYGGSSILASCMAFGFILSFSRRDMLGGRNA